MVSALETESIALGSSPGRGQCVVFFNKTLTCTMPVYKWVPAN